jgi:uncharacterized protein YegP (UPF0339 family)
LKSEPQGAAEILPHRDVMRVRWALDLKRGAEQGSVLWSGNTAMTFEIDFDRVRFYSWRLRTEGGEVAASGEGYLRKQDCLEVVDALRSGEFSAALLDLTEVPPDPSPRQ